MKFIKDIEKLSMFYAGYVDPRTAPFKLPYDTFNRLQKRMDLIALHLQDKEFPIMLFIYEKAISQQNKGFVEK